MKNIYRFSHKIIFFVVSVLFLAELILLGLRIADYSSYTKSLGRYNSRQVVTKFDPKLPARIDVLGYSKSVFLDWSDVVLTSDIKLEIDEENVVVHEYSKESGFLYHIVLSNLESGINNILIDYVDENQYSHKNMFQVKRNPNDYFSEYVIDTSNIVFTPDILSVVDKENRLLEYYEPEDLVNVSEYAIPVSSSSIRLREVLIEDLKTMMGDMNASGANVLVTSGYRSFDKQVETFNYWLNYNNGNLSAADRISARPGHSEHQLGLTIDFVSAQNNYQLTPAFAFTNAGKWLHTNAYKYGFVLSYPEEATEVTGYSYEPWHWRYIGKEAALAFYNSNLVLSNFLVEY